MNILCFKPCVACPPSFGGGVGPVDPANPFVNLSSEEPDVDDFFGRRYSIGLPPLGSNWFQVGCVGFCVSDISQEDADLCAARQAVFCQATNWPPTIPNPNPLSPLPFIPVDATVYFNDAQQCSFTCPDGSVYIFTVAAGVFASVVNQETVNLMAYSFACEKAVQNFMCLGALSPARSCAGAVYSGTVVASTSNTPVTFNLVTPLPDGLLLAQNETTAFIDGTPTTPGDYTFTLRATDSIGQTVDKIVDLSFFGVITDSPLPNATVSSPYSTLLESGGTPAATPVWSVVSGALPSGMSINPATGEISGTPDTAEDAQFVIQITDGILTCQKPFTLTAEEDIDWSGLTWSGEAGFGDWSFVGSLTGAVAFAESTSGVTAAGVNAIGQGLYTGAAINFILTINSYTPSGSPEAGFAFSQDAVPILEIAPADITGPFPMQFQIPVAAGVNSIIEITGKPSVLGFIFCDGSGNNSLTMDFTFEPEP